MNLQFRCPQCAQLVQTPAEAVGKKCRCPGCSLIFDVPPSAEATPDWKAADPVASRADNPFAEANPFANTTNPFAEQAPRIDAPRPDANNPYSSPQYTSLPGPLTVHPESQVRGPAVGLVICGILGIISPLLSFGRVLGMRIDGEGMIVFAVFGLAVVTNAVVIGGATRMMNLRSYGLSITACVLAMVPCLGCCWLGLPIGIWGLVVLNNPQVRSAFTS